MYLYSKSVMKIRKLAVNEEKGGIPYEFLDSRCYHRGDRDPG
jgi:hypothetical protein